MTSLKRFTTLTLTLAVSGLLTACGAAAPGASTMSLKTVGASKPAAAKAAAKTPAKPAAAKPAATKAAADAIALPDLTEGVATGGAVPTSAAIRQAAYAAAGAGSVKVALGSLPARRALLGLDDIANVRVNLTCANGAVRTGTVARAAFGSGVAFDGIPTGAATVTVEALDAAGTVLGSSSAATTVTAGQTAAVALTVKVAADAPAVASTGNVTANVTFVEEPTNPVATATPTPAPTATPSPIASLPTFLQTPVPTATPVATPTPAPTATPAPAGLTTDVWGRLYDYNGTQQMSGTVRYLSTDASRPFEVVVALRDDGYYYIPAVPSGVTMEVTAWSGNTGSQAWYVFTSTGAVGAYEWLDIFVQAW